MKCFRGILIAALYIFALCSCAANEEDRKITDTNTAMGTIILQSIYVDFNPDKEPELARGITGGVTDLIDLLETELLSWRLETSEIYRINQAAGETEGIAVSPELYRILEEALEISAESDGALDITLGSLSQLWNISNQLDDDEPIVIPTSAQVENALSAAGYARVTLGQNHITLPEDMQLDLGAVGKGLACDNIADYLKARPEVTGAVISVGGSIMTYGSKPDGSTWKVGIVNPRESSGYLGFLELEGEWFVSTSGDYEQYLEADGVRYHHILDPADGYPADNGIIGVTILCREGLLGDALSTACFVAGVEQGLTLAAQYGAQALIVDTDGIIHMTEGMAEIVQLQ